MTVSNLSAFTTDDFLGCQTGIHVLRKLENIFALKTHIVDCVFFNSSLICNFDCPQFFGGTENDMCFKTRRT